jgi:ABC-type Fe3+-siderophore transport system, permease component
LLIILLATLTISLGVGAVRLTPLETISALFNHAAKSAHRSIIWDFRLPRILLVALCGAALAIAGVGFQGLFRNPLADPYVVGASGGAALGATLAIMFRFAQPSIPIGIGAFIGSMLAVMVVFAISEFSNFGSIAGLLLAGSAMSAMLTAIVSLLLMMNDEVLHGIYAWLLGSFSDASWGQLRQALVLAPPAIIIIWLMARSMDALAAGEETAQSLGLNLRRARFLIVIGSSLATAAAVSVSGIVGFVGLIAPHLARSLVGANHKNVIPISMLMGSLLLLIADDLARTIMAPVEMPVGIFTALLGGPFFIYLMKRGERGS